MSLSGQISALATRIATEIKSLRGEMPRVISYQDPSEYEAYPLGYSTFEVTDVAEGWPATRGTVTTNKVNSSRTFQWFHSGNSSAAYTRTYHSSVGWRNWIAIAQSAPAGMVIRLLWDGTAYPAKNGPAGAYYDFEGPVNPGNLMADGDSWTESA